MLERIKSYIYRFYSFTLSIAFTVLIYFTVGINNLYTVLTSDHMQGALGAVMTFASIVLGFIGVLLTAIVGIKQESNIVKYFFDNADKKYFANVVKRNIFSGLFMAVVCVIMFFSKDISTIRNDDQIAVVMLFLLWIFLLLYFVFSTYRLMSLLLSLLFRSGEIENTISEGQKLPEQNRKEMEEKHKHSEPPNK